MTRMLSATKIRISVTAQAARHIASAMTAIAFGATAAFAQTTAPAPSSDTPAMAMPAAKSMMQRTDMARSMERMHQKMSAMSMTGDPDMDFAMMMKAHHEGALDMAQAELDHGKNPTMRASAKKIITAQKKEIAEFDRWMAKHPAAHTDAVAK
jgi:uncharacterized protein (DUF305 family)